MTDVALRMEQVYKIFRKGETYNSLRDLIPALTGRMFRQQDLGEADKREFWALRDISFELKPGEVLGIIGPNGAGKSTMLKLLSRVMKPTRGSIYVNGRVSALIELAAGLHPDLTGRENIYLYGTILGMTKQQIAAKFDQIVEFSGLAEFIDTPIKRYSSGMYARLGFSVAAHGEPDVFIVDEVLSVGDYLFQQRCMEHMRSVIKDGTTIVFVSHNLKALTELCPRAMYLRDGKIVRIDSTDALVRRYLSDLREPEILGSDKPVFISKVRLRSLKGEQSTFESGEIALVDVEVTARENVNRLAVVIWLVDDNNYEIFNTSTERLGHGTISLRAEETYQCTFELTLNMAHGAFHVCIGVHRYDIQTSYDRRIAAATIFISSTMAVRGAVNCFPRLLQADTATAIL